VLLKIILKKRV